MRVTPDAYELHARSPPACGVPACAAACLPASVDEAVKSLEWNRSWLCSGLRTRRNASPRNLRNRTSAVSQSPTPDRSHPYRASGLVLWHKAAVAPSPIPAVRPFQGSAHVTPRRLRSVGDKLHNSRSPAMRNAGDAFICSVFCYPPNQLTVFPGAGIAAKLLPPEIPSKSFAWGRKLQIAA